MLLDDRRRQLLLRLLLACLLLPPGQVCPGGSASGEGLETGDGGPLRLGLAQDLPGPSGSEHPQACLYPHGRMQLLSGPRAIGSSGVWQVGDVYSVEARCGLLLLLKAERHTQGRVRPEANGYTRASATARAERTHTLQVGTGRKLRTDKFEPSRSK